MEPERQVPAAMPLYRPARRRTAVAGIVAAATVALSSCGSGGPGQQDPTTGATPAGPDSTDTQAICPETLPQPPEPSEGPRDEEPAEVAPSLPAPEQAWVCRYGFEDATAPGGEQSSLRWSRTGAAVEVPDQTLPRLARDLRRLRPPAPDLLCTADIGPRWMLVYDSADAGEGRIGVVVDSFGCGYVRLTDDPFQTPPGHSTGEGTVPGVLVGPQSLLRRLQGVTGEA